MTSVVLLGDHPLVITCADQLEAVGISVAGVTTADPAVLAWADGNDHEVVSWSDLTSFVRDRNVDTLLSIGNLRIIPDELLAAVDLAVNFHDGPLPELAGVHAPMWAILQGRPEHGVTWHVIEGDIDAGDVLAERRFPIAPDETTRTLNLKCLTAGAEAFSDVVPQLARGTLDRHPQTRGHDEYHGRWDRPLVANLLDVGGTTVDEIGRIVRALDFGSTLNRVGRPLVDLGDAILVVEGSAAVTGAAAARPPGTIVAVEVHGDEIELDAVAADGVIRLRGRADIADPDRLVDQQLTPPPLETLRNAHERAVRSEAAWTRDFADAHPLDLAEGAVDAEPRAGAPIALAEPSWVGAVAVVVAFLARRSGQHRAVVDIPLDESGHPALASHGPLVVEPSGETAREVIASISDAVTDRRSRGPVPVDLLLRRPQQVQRPPRLPRAGVRIAASSADAGSAPVTVVIDDAGATCTFVTGDPQLELHLREGLQAFIGALVSDPSLRFVDAPVAGVTERAVTEAAPTTAHTPTGSLVDRFRTVAAAAPHAPAVAHGVDEWTYEHLDLAARTVAAHLLAAGVEPGDAVGLSAAPSCAAVAGLLGTLMAGAAYVPLDPRFPADRLAYMAADAGVAVVLRDQTSSVVGAAELLDIGEVSTVGSTDPVSAPVPTAADDVAYVMYTSGSTGRPKGVVVDHGNVLGFLDAMEPITGTTNGVWLSVTTLSFDISVLELFQPLLHGWKVVLYEGLAAALEGPRAEGPGVDLSFFFFGSGQDSDYRLLLDVARFADDQGFTAVWTPERHFHAFGGPYPNPSVTAAAVAAVTERVGIRAGSCVLPLHHPVRVAEEWAVVDRMSNGRVGLSVATGWHPDDFILRPENYGLGKDALAEQIETVQRLWRGEAVTFPGPEGPVDVSTLPRPVQERLPMWYTTAGNPASFEFAGRHGLNLLTHLLGQSLDQVAANIERYRSAWADAGYDGDGNVVLMLHTYVAASRAEARDVVREPMKAYLRDSVGLLRDVASSFPTFDADADADSALASLSPEDMDALLEAGFERYFETSGLFGSPDDAFAFAVAVADAGVDEIACLCDFGVDNDLVRASLPGMAQLRRRLEHNDDADTYGSLIRRHGVTHMQCTPSEARIVLADPDSRAALADLDTMLVGGEALPVEVADALLGAVGGSLVNMYGPTETTIWSTSHRVTAADVAAGAIPIGRPLSNTFCRVVDERGAHRPAGQIGELLIGGTGVTAGYHGRPERTAERFVSTPDGTMYRTGDLAAFNSDGTLSFHGRIDNQVKIRGHRVELGDIETALTAHDAVAQAIVTFAPGPGGEPLLAAHLVAEDPTAAPSPDEVLAAAAEGLPGHMQPVTARWWASLPVTPNGKVDRLSLGAAEPGADAEALSVTPELREPVDGPAIELSRGEVADLVAEVWADVLATDVVDRATSFFDHGGNSLQIITVRQRLEGRLGRPVALVDLFRYATVNELAAAFSPSDAGPRPPKAEPEPERVGVGAPTVAPGVLGDRAARRAAVRRQRRNR